MDQRGFSECERRHHDGECLRSGDGLFHKRDHHGQPMRNGDGLHGGDGNSAWLAHHWRDALCAHRRHGVERRWPDLAGRLSVLERDSQCRRSDHRAKLDLRLCDHHDQCVRNGDGLCGGDGVSARLDYHRRHDFSDCRQRGHQRRERDRARRASAPHGDDQLKRADRLARLGRRGGLRGHGDLRRGDGSAATATTAGSITVGGIIITRAPGTVLELVTIGANLCLPLPPLPTPTPTPGPIENSLPPRIAMR
jgi:hypothetical protein